MSSGDPTAHGRWTAASPVPPQRPERPDPPADPGRPTCSSAAGRRTESPVSWRLNPTMPAWTTLAATGTKPLALAPGFDPPSGSGGAAGPTRRWSSRPRICSSSRSRCCGPGSRSSGSHRSSRPVGPSARFWGIPFVAIGLYLVVGRFFYKRWDRRRTRYAITDQRVVIIRSAGRDVKSGALAEPNEVKRRRDGEHATFVWSMPPDPSSRRGPFCVRNDVLRPRGSRMAHVGPIQQRHAEVLRPRGTRAGTRRASD